MIQVDIKPEWVKSAKAKAAELGTINRSFTKGDGNVAGFLGEYIVADYLKAEITNTHDYDLIKNGVKIDVKTKRCTTPPSEHYECSISTYYKQRCDFYVFVRVMKDWSKGWILGIIRPKKYFDTATFYKKGTTDYSNGMTFKADSWNLEISKLLDFKKLLNI